MPEVRKPSSRKAAPVSAWWHPSADIDSLTPDQRLAHQLVVARRDLTPSVERIMNAPLEADARYAALQAFETSLTTPGDPNRDPRVAIANFTTASTEQQ